MLHSVLNRAACTAGALCVFLLLHTSCVSAPHIIGSLGTKDRVVALTFDACESETPSYFDTTILNYLVSHKIPATIFLGGKFSDRNGKAIEALRGCTFLEFENHSFSHVLHMERLSADDAAKEVRKAEASILEHTGKKPKFFRFPGGNHDARVLAQVEAMGYRVVHWSFPSGDPDKHVTAAKMIPWVVDRAKPGTILIFHINGRGYNTGKALPSIVGKLRANGFSFVRLDNYITAGKQARPRPTAAAGKSETLCRVKDLVFCIPVARFPIERFLGASLFYVPVDVVRDGLPWFGAKRDDWLAGRPLRHHLGIDVYGDSLVVLAAADGTVERDGATVLSGPLLKIDHGEGIKTVYIHLSSLLVKKGQRVKKGEPIGYCDRPAGNGVATQLHFEIEADHRKLDPLPLIEKSHHSDARVARILASFPAHRDSIDARREKEVKQFLRTPRRHPL